MGFIQLDPTRTLEREREREREGHWYLKLALEKVKLLVKVIDSLIVCLHRGRLACGVNLQTKPISHLKQQDQRYFLCILNQQLI